jgi:hypothetical protein
MTANFSGFFVPKYCWKEEEMAEYYKITDFA